MGNIIQIVSDAGIMGYLIVGMGLISIALIFERIKALYFDYTIKSDQFSNQIKSLILDDKIEDAITFCSTNKKAPLAHVTKSILERSDRDEDSINLGLDISLAEIIPLLGKRLGYLSMIANVVTLMGLLGTITGLIMAFAAVSDADPTQKSEILAKGISMAMNTTALGLSVAIPVMILYSFLHTKQNAILENIAEHSAKVVDLLTNRQYHEFTKKHNFPKLPDEIEMAAKTKENNEKAS